MQRAGVYIPYRKLTYIQSYLAGQPLHYNLFIARQFVMATGTRSTVMARLISHRRRRVFHIACPPASANDRRLADEVSLCPSVRPSVSHTVSLPVQREYFTNSRSDTVSTTSDVLLSRRINSMQLETLIYEQIHV